MCRQLLPVVTSLSGGSYYWPNNMISFAARVLSELRPASALYLKGKEQDRLAGMHGGTPRLYGNSRGRNI